MHESVMRWIQEQVRYYSLTNEKTLEVGSLNENGSVRTFFNEHLYTGVDMRSGRGVDRVMNAHHLSAYFGEGEFDVVISTEMLEHDDQFWLSMQEMGHVLKDNGLLLITARGNGFPLHAYPDDFYRFMPSAAPFLLRLAKCLPLDTMSDPQDPGIFAIGRRCPRVERTE